MMGRENTVERQRRIRYLFESALAFAPDRQKDYVLHETGKDTGLAESVLRLLSASRASGGFLAKPLLAPESLSLQGVKLGAYQIERQLGQGGMGVVYLAARADDVFRRQAAVKVIKPEFNSPQMVERFKQERQILANLDHPNIARILDGGTTSSGYPYFVMDYVDGRPVDTFCNDRRASLEQRLNLFRQACDAVQYLHENRIIHRDLKPANMLVTGQGSLKLLDFGIAKILNADSGFEIKTAPLLTPGYASPEQVNGKTAGAPSDIYSLGAILYELLTGQRPHGHDGRSAAEVIESISKDLVRRPSVCAGTNSVLQIEESPVELRKRLRGDLDSIVMNALRKEPEERYASVADMSADIGRYQAQLPVQARDGATLYVVSRYARRNRFALAAASLILGLASIVGADELRIRHMTQQFAAARIPLGGESGKAGNAGPPSDANVHAGLKVMTANYKRAFPELLDDPLASRVKVSRLVGDDLDWLRQVTPFAATKPELTLQLGSTYFQVAQAQWSDDKPSLKDVNGSLATCNQAAELLKQLPLSYANQQAVKDLEANLAHQMHLLKDAH